MKKRDIAIIITLISLFAIIAILLETGNIINIENFVYDRISQFINPTFTTVVKIITNIGGPIIITVICITLLIFHQTRRKYGLPVLTALLVTFILNTILKYIFARPRPTVLRLINETGYSFPSGHSMVNSALYTMIILLLLENSDVKFRKVILSIFLGILIILIGLSRIYLGVHYLGDVLGGWILGILVSLVVYKIYREKEH